MRMHRSVTLFRRGVHMCQCRYHARLWRYLFGGTISTSVCRRDHVVVVVVVVDVIVQVCCVPSRRALQEEPERDIMLQPPRSLTKDRLVNGKLIFHAYFVIGVLESTAAFINYFWYMTSQGFSMSDLVFAWAWGEEGYAGFTIDQQVRLALLIPLRVLVKCMCVRACACCTVRGRARRGY